VAKQFGRTKLKELKFGLTFEQLMVLFILEETDGLDLGELAVRTDRDRTTTTRMIDGLEKANMVLRVTDRQDARRKLVYLTPEGRRKLDALGSHAQQFDQSFYGGVSVNDTRTTVTTLKAMIANLTDGMRQTDPAV
jgi:DNA-binding MarR family transcriptional regulator